MTLTTPHDPVPAARRSRFRPGAMTYTLLVVLAIAAVVLLFGKPGERLRGPAHPLSHLISTGASSNR